MNENYGHPAMPKEAEAGILKGMYQLHKGKQPRKQSPRVQLLGSGTILRECLAAAKLLEKDFGVLSDLWSVTSFNELAREGREVERWNLLHPGDSPKIAYVTNCLEGTSGPVIAATDYVRNYAEQIRQFISNRYFVLGTDGFGRSGTRKQLREFFEVDRHYIALTALKALVDEKSIPSSTLLEAAKSYGIDANKPNPISA